MIPENPRSLKTDGRCLRLREARHQAVESEEAATLVQQFYPSELGGYALADILYGEVTPSGKLSVSFPYDVETLPIYYDHLKLCANEPKPGREHENSTVVVGNNYVLETPIALCDEFGYGLSYSCFEFSDISVSKSNVSTSNTITVSVNVANKSKRDGAEVVLRYVKDMPASVDVPRYQLEGFKKVMVEAEKSKTVQIDLEVADWGRWDRKMEYVVEPGEFTVLVGNSSENLMGNITVIVS